MVGARVLADDICAAAAVAVGVNPSRNRLIEAVRNIWTFVCEAFFAFRGGHKSKESGEHSSNTKAPTMPTQVGKATVFLRLKYEGY